MPEPDGSVLLGLLADDVRRRVLAALILGASTIPEVRAETGLTARQAANAMSRLVAAELVVPGADGTYVLLGEAFRRAAISSAPARSESKDPFFRDGKIVAIPMQRAKRLVLLDLLAQEFDVGVRYKEREVNAVLRRFHEDYAALRRYLVDEGLMDRERGEYWRSGGTYRA